MDEFLQGLGALLLVIFILQVIIFIKNDDIDIDDMPMTFHVFGVLLGAAGATIFAYLMITIAPILLVILIPLLPILYVLKELSIDNTKSAKNGRNSDSTSAKRSSKEQNTASEPTGDPEPLSPSEAKEFFDDTDSHDEIDEHKKAQNGTEVSDEGTDSLDERTENHSDIRQDKSRRIDPVYTVTIGSPPAMPSMIADFNLEKDLNPERFNNKVKAERRAKEIASKKMEDVYVVYSDLRRIDCFEPSDDGTFRQYIHREF